MEAMETVFCLDWGSLTFKANTTIRSSFLQTRTQRDPQSHRLEKYTLFRLLQPISHSLIKYSFSTIKFLTILTFYFEQQHIKVPFKIKYKIILQQQIYLNEKCKKTNFFYHSDFGALSSYFPFHY